jgi:hypothetical protein
VTRSGGIELATEDWRSTAPWVEFLIDHAIALAEIVCGATFVQLEGVGHELHEVHWDDIIAAIIEHTER